MTTGLIRLLAFVLAFGVSSSVMVVREIERREFTPVLHAPEPCPTDTPTPCRQWPIVALVPTAPAYPTPRDVAMLPSPER